MADSLLAKTSTVDRLSGERSSLKLQLEQESKRVTSLEQSLRLAQVRAAAAAANSTDGTNDSAGSDVESGGGAESFKSRSDDLKTRTANALDMIGLRVGVALRRYPMLRIGFAIYIILMHVFLMFIFYHF